MSLALTSKPLAKTKPTAKAKPSWRAKSSAKAMLPWKPKADKYANARAQVHMEKIAVRVATTVLKTAVERSVAKILSRAVKAVLTERAVEQKVGEVVATILQKKPESNSELVALFQGQADDLLPL
jgi:hypothetical protein